MKKTRLVGTAMPSRCAAHVSVVGNTATTRARMPPTSHHTAWRSRSVDLRMSSTIAATARSAATIPKA